MGGQDAHKSMGEEDIAIIFDTKGEFFDGFSREGDYVIGNSARFRPVVVEDLEIVLGLEAL